MNSSANSISNILKKIQDDQIRDTLDIFEYFVCQKEIENIKNFINIYMYKNTKTKYLISSINSKQDLFLSNKKDKIKTLDNYSKGYYNNIKNMIQEYNAHKKITEKTYNEFSKKRNELNTFFTQLIIDIEGYEKKYDSLTGLLNRKYFLEETKMHFGRMNYTIVMADIDHFKSINDNYGHPIGDLVIKNVANVFKENLRSNDIIGRYGGEEFIFALNGKTSETYTVVDRLRKTIEDLNLKIDDFSKEIKFTCSFGIVDSDPNIPIANLIKRADKALYLSKENGRNRVTIFENLN